MRLHTRSLVLAGFLQLLVAGSSYASFHFIDINEVYSNADGTVQFVELIAFSAGQTELHRARIVARGPNGLPVTLVVDLTTDFPLLSNTETILIATAGFEAVAGFAPDYVIPNNGLIPFPAGQITWEPDPGEIGVNPVDRVAYGAYTGALPAEQSPAAALPCNGRRSLNRTNTNNNPSLGFAVSNAPSPKRNDGTTVTLQLAPGTDCNGNSSPDLCDIATGFSLDANGDHVPDECDPPPGCQGDPESCDDGDVCNGVETCNLESGQCVDGTSLNCNDDNACTVDDCDSVSGCFMAPRNCDDNDACTFDGCNPVTGCFTEPRSCDDGDACTIDGCDRVTGCSTIPQDCDDNDVCTVDGCDSVTGCFSDPRDCDDGDPCNREECVPEVGCQSESICGPGFGCLGGECLCFEPRGDFDGDGHLDADDTLHELGCLNGPEAEVLPDCGCADLDGDGDIDLLDLAEHFNDLSVP